MAKSIFIAILMSLASLSVHAAWNDAAKAGKVIKVSLIGGGGGAPGNFDARVTLDSGTSVSYCDGNNSSNWGYINTNDANYKGVLAGILTAYALGKPVHFYMEKDTNGYCKITYFTLN